MLARFAFASSLFLVLACPADDGDGATTVADASSGAGDTASNPTTDATGAMTTAPADTGATTAPADTGATTAPADSGETTAPADTGSSSAATEGGTTGSAVDPCEVVPGDDACNTCVKGMCCEELTACSDDPDCVCFQDCAGSMPPSLQTPAICGDMCGLATPFQHPTVGPVLTCSNGCIASCI